MRALSILHPPGPGKRRPFIMRPLWVSVVVCLLRLSWRHFTIVPLFPLGVFLLEPVKPCFLRGSLEKRVRTYDLVGVAHTSYPLDYEYWRRFQKKSTMPY